MKKGYVVLATLFIMIFSMNAYGDLLKDWVARYEGPYLDKAYDIAVDDDGDIYVTGISSNGNDIDFLTIKYNGDTGESLWVKSFNGGNGDDTARAIVVFGDGIYITGEIDAGNDEDILTIKYNPATGDTIWTSQYDGPASDNDAGYDIGACGGGIYVTGESENGTDYDCILIKYDPSDGDIIWVRRFDEGIADNDEYGASLAIDNGCNIYVAGGGEHPLHGVDYLIIKYSLSGTQVWRNWVDGSGATQFDFARDIALDSYNNACVTGGSNGFLSGEDYLTVKKRSSDGVEICSTRYNGPINNYDRAYAIAVDDDGSIYVTGTSMRNIQFMQQSIVTIKYDPYCDQVWVKTFGGMPYSGDIGRDIILDGNGNVFVTGRSLNNFYNNDYVILQYDCSDGTLIDSDRYDGPGGGVDDAFAMAIDDSQNVIITGQSTGDGTGLDFATIKYVEPCYISGTVSFFYYVLGGMMVTGSLADVTVLILPNIGCDTTDSVGDYQIGISDTGTYDISFSHPDYCDIIVRDFKITCDTTLDISMSLTGSITGTVTDTCTVPNPIAGVTVCAGVNGVGYYDCDITDTNGQYLLEGIFIDTCDVFVTHPCYGDTLIEDIIITFCDTTVLDTVKMQPPGSIEGTVTDTNTIPIENVIIEILNLSLYDTTDSIGKYSFEQLYPGIYDILFTHEDYEDILVEDFELICDTTLDIVMIVSTCYEYLPGDINMYIYMNDTITWPTGVTGADVTYLVNYFRGMTTSIPCYMFDPVDSVCLWASADVNGDCNVIGSDVTKLVSYLRGVGSLSWCTDFPPCWPTPADLPDERPYGWPNCDTINCNGKTTVIQSGLDK